MSATTAVTDSRALLADAPRLKSLFAEQGYLVLKSVVPVDLLAHLHGRIVEEFERAQGTGGLFPGGGRLAGHLNCFPGEGARQVFQVLEEQGVVDLVRSISPKVVRLPNVGCNFNLPGSIVQHYHTDSDFTRDFMIANVAMVDTTVENGATEVMPGTNRQFYRYWRFALARLRQPGLRVMLNRGDVLVRTSVLWHRGMPNRSSAVRPMLAFTWEDGGSEHADPFQVDEGRITFKPNWYRPTRLGRLRERMYLAAPITYEAYRFARSLVSSKGN